MSKRNPISYAYQTVNGDTTTLTVLPRCSSLASLLRQTPENAVPGTYDERDDRFRPLAARSAA